MEPYRPNEPFIKMKLNGSLLDRMIESGIPLTRALQYFRDNPEGSALETLKLAAEDVVPFYGNYRNNGDWSDYAKEAVMLAAPMPKGGKYSPITGRDGKVRYIADEIIKPDVEKNLEFIDKSYPQLEPYNARDISTSRITGNDGPYFRTPDYDDKHILFPENSAGWSTHVPTEYADFNNFTGEFNGRTYSRSGLKPENINRSLKEYDLPVEPLVKGTEEWQKAVDAANAYEDFIKNNFNDRTSYVGKGSAYRHPLAEQDVTPEVTYGEMTPKELYNEILPEMSKYDVMFNRIMHPRVEELTNERMRSNLIDAVLDPQTEQRRYNAAFYNTNREISDALQDRVAFPRDRKPVGMRLSDYKNILESLSYKPSNYEYTPGYLKSEFKEMLNNIDNPMIGPEEKAAMTKVVDVYSKLFEELPANDWKGKERLRDLMINDLKAAGLEYIDW